MRRTEDRTTPIDICDVVDMERVVSQRVVCTARRADAVLITGLLNGIDTVHVVNVKQMQVA
jgi:hypothetical protein